MFFLVQFSICFYFVVVVIADVAAVDVVVVIAIAVAVVEFNILIHTVNRIEFKIQ